MAWCQTGDKQLGEPMMAKITDIHASLSLNEFNIFMKFRTGQLHLKFNIVMRPTLCSLAVPQFIVTTTRVASDDKVGIMITLF